MHNYEEQMLGLFYHSNILIKKFAHKRFQHRNCFPLQVFTARSGAAECSFVDIKKLLYIFNLTMQPEDTRCPKKGILSIGS